MYKAVHQWGQVSDGCGGEGQPRHVAMLRIWQFLAVHRGWQYFEAWLYKCRYARCHFERNTQPQTQTAESVHAVVMKMFQSTHVIRIVQSVSMVAATIFTFRNPFYCWKLVKTEQQVDIENKILSSTFRNCESYFTHSAWPSWPLTAQIRTSW